MKVSRRRRLSGKQKAFMDRKSREGMLPKKKKQVNVTEDLLKSQLEDTIKQTYFSKLYEAEKKEAKHQKADKIFKNMLKLYNRWLKNPDITKQLNNEKNDIAQVVDQNEIQE